MAFNYNQYLNSQLNQVNSYYDQQKAAELAQLKAQQTSALAKVNQQKAATQTQYYGQRNQNDVVNQQNVNRLRELMAQNGLNSSGENISANVALSNQRQNSLNALNTQEQAQMNDYANQINDINSPDKQNAYLSQWNAEKAKALQDTRSQAEQMANTYAQQDFQNKMQQDQWALDKQLKELQLQQAKASRATVSGGASRSHASSKRSSYKTNSVPKVVQEQAKAYTKWFAPPKKISKNPSQNLTYSTHGITRQAGY